MEGEDIKQSVSELYHQAGVGRPYRRDTGVQDECRWFLCMNPLQSSLLSAAEFLEMDVTFENSRVSIPSQPHYFQLHHNEV